MDNPIGWYASISGIVAALLIAVDMGRRVTGWAFVIFITTSLAWIGAGVVSDQQSIVWQNVVMLGTNFVGVYRWLIRRKRN